MVLSWSDLSPGQRLWTKTQLGEFKKQNGCHFNNHENRYLMDHGLPLIPARWQFTLQLTNVQKARPKQRSRNGAHCRKLLCKLLRRSSQSFPRKGLYKLRALKFWRMTFEDSWHSWHGLFFAMEVELHESATYLMCNYLLFICESRAIDGNCSCCFWYVDVKLALHRIFSAIWIESW